MTWHKMTDQELIDAGILSEATGLRDKPVEFDTDPGINVTYQLDHVHVAGKCVKNRFPECEAK